MTITSAIPGRIRVRDQRLTRTDRAEQIRGDLLAMNGVSEVTVAPRTGSLLIVYSTATAALQGITDFLCSIFGPAVESAEFNAYGCSSGVTELFSSGTRLHKNSVNLGMIISLLTSLIGIAVGAETLHIVAGVLFLAALSVHLFERRRNIYTLG